MNIREVAQEYFTSITTTLHPRTRASYVQRLTLFADWCALARVQLEQVDNLVVHRFLVQLYETRKSHKAGKTALSMQTLHGYLRVIRAFLIWCLENDRYAGFVNYRTVRTIRFDETLFL